MIGLVKVTAVEDFCVYFRLHYVGWVMKKMHPVWSMKLLGRTPKMHIVFSDSEGDEMETGRQNSPRCLLPDPAIQIEEWLKIVGALQVTARGNGCAKGKEKLTAFLCGNPEFELKKPENDLKTLLTKVEQWTDAKPNALTEVYRDPVRS